MTAADWADAVTLAVVLATAYVVMFAPLGDGDDE